MNTLEALRVEESRGVADDHPAIAAERRHGPPSTVGQGLGAVTHDLSAFQQLGNEGMLLEALQHVLRISARDQGSRVR